MCSFMTYPETVKYLESFIDYEKIPQFPYKESFKLERIKEFLAALDQPQDKIRCIHIAGTKGKGSVCAFIAYILKQAGYKVGLYTSPHLCDFRERIRILDSKFETQSLDKLKIDPERSRMGQNSKLEFERMISEDEIVNLTEKLRPAIERFTQKSKYQALSFFEVYTALALVYFKEKNVDFAVLETGLGGRLDATNVVRPLICGITSISYEHTQKLGNTLREIAAEKAGIIKERDSIVIAAPQEKEAQDVIRKRCKEQGARLFQINQDIFFEEVDSNQEGQLFNISTAFSEYPHLKIKLLGRHQLINATLALGIVEALRYYDIFIGLDAIRQGLYNTIWPGRLEIRRREPYVVLDGAQNVQSSYVLKEAIKSFFNYRRLILILGISKDKDIKGVCEVLFDLADEIIITKADNPRAALPKTIRDETQDLVHRAKIYLTNNVKEALELGRLKAGPNDLILITGSLFVAGEARPLLT